MRQTAKQKGEELLVVQKELEGKLAALKGVSTVRCLLGLGLGVTQCDQCFFGQHPLFFYFLLINCCLHLTRLKFILYIHSNNVLENVLEKVQFPLANVLECS